MRLLVILFLSTLFSFSCSIKERTSDKISLKDSALNEFIRHTSGSKYYDTSTYTHQFLINYYRNDTAYLKKSIADIHRDTPNVVFPENVRQHVDIMKLKAQESYQLSYSRSFCKYNYFYTISNFHDTITFQSVVYENNFENSYSTKPIYEKTTSLSLETWNKFKGRLEYADFWGLNIHKSQIGFDGDYLTIEGVSRNKFTSDLSSSHIVHRRFVEGTALYNAFEYLNKLAVHKKYCQY